MNLNNYNSSSNTPQTLSNNSLFRKAMSHKNTNINNNLFKFEYLTINELNEDLRTDGFNDEIIPSKVTTTTNKNKFGCEHILELDFEKNFKKLNNHFKLQLRDFFMDLFLNDQDEFLNTYQIAIQYTIGNIATDDVKYINIPSNIFRKSSEEKLNKTKNDILRNIISFIKEKSEQLRWGVSSGATGLTKRNIDSLFSKWNNWKKNQPKFKYVLFRDALQTDIKNNKFYNLNSRSDIFGRSTSINISSNKILSRQLKETKSKKLINKDKALFIIKIDENNMESFPFYLYLISAEAEYDQYEFLLPNINFIAKNLEMVKVKLNKKFEACYAKLYLCESLKKYGSTYVKSNYSSKPINSGGNNKFIKNKIYIGPKGGKYVIINHKKKYIK